MEEKKLREESIGRYENGESPKQIYESLGKGKTWFFKWLKRSQHDGKNWSEERSRRPHKTRPTIGRTMEQIIIDTRKQLEKTLYAQIGALSISWKLKEQDIKPPPISTINKVIKRNNLTRKRLPYEPSGIDYPGIEATHSNHLHQFDIVGPRYLKDNGRFYSANTIDAYDRRCIVEPCRNRAKVDVINALVRSWQTLGIPQYLQMDNLLSTRGSNKYPHSFGIVIRLCLYLGIQPVFIPIGEPWRNGIIEHFQNVFDKMFFRTQFFKSFLYLKAQARDFETFHNYNHRYSTMKGKTPMEQVTKNLKYLPEDFELSQELPICPGKIHLVRFIRSNRILDIFGEKFSMPIEVEYEYVWATIDTKKETLGIYHDSKLVEEREYPLPKTSINLSKIDL